MLLLGAATSKGSNVQGELSTIPIANLKARSPVSRSTFAQRDEDDLSYGYNVEATVDSSDYINNTPSLVQLNKNQSLDGSLSIVEIRKPAPEKMVRLSQDEDE